MNRKKKLLRVIAMTICLVLIMGVNVGISAAETESNFEMVSNAYELESAIKRADEGDEIILLHEIEISNDKGDYAVSGNYKEENIKLTRYSGNQERIVEKFFLGGLIFGLIVCGALGFCIFMG